MIQIWEIWFPRIINLQKHKNLASYILFKAFNLLSNYFKVLMVWQMGKSETKLRAKMLTLLNSWIETVPSSVLSHLFFWTDHYLWIEGLKSVGPRQENIRRPVPCFKWQMPCNSKLMKEEKTRKVEQWPWHSHLVDHSCSRLTSWMSA